MPEFIELKLRKSGSQSIRHHFQTRTPRSLDLNPNETLWAVLEQILRSGLTLPSSAQKLGGKNVFKSQRTLASRQGKGAFTPCFRQRMIWAASIIYPQLQSVLQKDPTKLLFHCESVHCMPYCLDGRYNQTVMQQKDFTEMSSHFICSCSLKTLLESGISQQPSE